MLDPGAGETKRVYVWAYARDAFDALPDFSQWNLNNSLGATAFEGCLPKIFGCINSALDNEPAGNC